jgi:hypothetical protein
MNLTQQERSKTKLKCVRYDFSNIFRIIFMFKIIFYIYIPVSGNLFGLCVNFIIAQGPNRKKKDQSAI